jgi:hypothetical protein
MFFRLYIPHASPISIAAKLRPKLLTATLQVSFLSYVFLFAGHYDRENEARSTFLDCKESVWKDKGDVAKKYEYIISASIDHRQ